MSFRKKYNLDIPPNRRYNTPILSKRQVCGCRKADNLDARATPGNRFISCVMSLAASFFVCVKTIAFCIRQTVSPRERAGLFYLAGVKNYGESIEGHAGV